MGMRTVLFTTAGMHPLVPCLLGEPHPAGTRLVNVQKCLRTGDIDAVGDEAVQQRGQGRKGSRSHRVVLPSPIPGSRAAGAAGTNGQDDDSNTANHRHKLQTARRPRGIHHTPA